MAWFTYTISSEKPVELLNVNGFRNSVVERDIYMTDFVLASVNSGEIRFWSHYRSEMEKLRRKLSDTSDMHVIGI